jgi:CRISPR-associated protein Cas1
MLTLPDFKQKQIVFAFLSYGEKLKFSNDNIVILDENDNIKHQSTCYRLFALFVVGHITITSGLLQKSEKFGFSIVLLTHNLRIYAILGSKTEGNTLLRTKQYKYNSLDIAFLLVDNKIENQRLVLENIRNKNQIMEKSISKLNIYKNKISKDLQLKDLLGLEGVASRVYFNALFKDFNWGKRMPRAKQDITNCLLDIGYTILFNITEAMLNLYGFDVYQGVYHRQFYQRKSLACDLMEPFRPIIDARIYKSI